MIKAQECISRVRDFLAKRISLEEFEDWSADALRNVYRDGSKDAKAIVQLVRSILNSHEEDAEEVCMRQELATAILPFVDYLPSAKVVMLRPIQSPVKASLIAEPKMNFVWRIPQSVEGDDASVVLGVGSNNNSPILPKPPNREVESASAFRWATPARAVSVL
jgi:hypothetical protein